MLRCRKSTRRVLVVLALVALMPLEAWSFGGTGGSGGGRPKAPPQEAIQVCEGKSAGDSVEFETRRGDTLTGVCQEIDGQLVAVPEGRCGLRKR